MNEQQLRALYNLYANKNLLSKDKISEEQWMNASEEQVEKLWNLGASKQLLDKEKTPLSLYQAAWGFGEESKKKEDGVSESADGISGGLSLEEIAMPQPEMFEMPRDEFLSSPTMQVEEQVRTQVSKQRGEEDRRQTEIIRQKEVLESAKDLEQIQQAEQELEAFREGDDLQSDLSLINENFTKRSEEEVIQDATKKYGKYGFIFEPARFGERMKVTTIDGSKEIDIKLDIDSEDSERLKNFIAANAQMPEEIQDDDYINKAFKVKASRRSKLLNEDGTVSTVRMASADNFAFPTVFACA